MTPDNWRRIKTLFEELEGAPEARRAQVIANLAASEPELAATLRGMLTISADADQRLRGLVGSAADVMIAASGAPLPRFGRYDTVREIGRGGMGVVYEAMSADEFRRRVAIKVAPLARLGALAGARFRQERQILSSLEHPYIARFLDAGTEGDLPYLVMEYVDGVPITDYVRTRRLPLAARLRTIQRVAQALQFAHQQLVVHRDLKPSNVLVTDDGTPRLLDFGIAKLIDAEGGPSPTLGIGGWTPDYASPELARGHVVGTPGDIYGLGLVLYEVLTGVRAQRVEAASPLAAAQAIAEATPPIPSLCATRAGDRALARQLRGDVDTIVMTCLEKDPAERYASAAALADDIDRYLHGHPIAARPATWHYKGRKWLSRNRVAAIAAGLIAAAGAAGIASTVYQARRAEYRFQQVRALANEFVFTVHDRIEALPGSTDARRAIVETALTYLGNLQQGAAGDPGLARELAAAYERVGTVQGHPLAPNLGEPDAAVASYERAIALLAPLEANGDPDATLQLASVIHKLANVRRAQGDLPATSRAFERALVLAERLRSAQPDRTDVLSLLGEINADVARAAMEARDLDTARTAAERSMRAADDLARARPGDPDLQNSLATSLNALGAVRLASGALEDAEATYSQAARIREQLVSEHPRNLEFRRALVVTYGNLGDVRFGRAGQNLGDAAGAEAVLERAVSLSRGMIEADVNDRRAQFDLANAALRLGSVLADVSARETDALVFYMEADRVTTRLLEGEPASERYRYLQVVLDRRLGRTLRVLGRVSEAGDRLGRARTGAATMLNGPNGPNARQQIALATVDLTALQSLRGDGRTLETARAAIRLLDEASLAPVPAAQARGELADSLVAVARRMSGAGRVEAASLALSLADEATRLWSAATLPAALQAQRDLALSKVSAARREAEGIVGS